MGCSLDVWGPSGFGSTHMTGPRAAVFAAYMVAVLALAVRRRFPLASAPVLVAALVSEWHLTAQRVHVSHVQGMHTPFIDAHDGAQTRLPTRKAPIKRLHRNLAHHHLPRWTRRLRRAALLSSGRERPAARAALSRRPLRGLARRARCTVRSLRADLQSESDEIAAPVVATGERCKPSFAGNGCRTLETCRPSDRLGDPQAGARQRLLEQAHSPGCAESARRSCPLSREGRGHGVATRADPRPACRSSRNLRQAWP
jgi:hypothetical protein